MTAKLQRFMDSHVWPVRHEYEETVATGAYPEALIDGLKEAARAEGLWNLFLPALRDDEPGTRMSNLEYAPMAEIMGRLPWASEVFNCNAPDTGNMEILHLFATPQQRERWLLPLMRGEIRSVRLDHRTGRRLVRSDKPRTTATPRRRSLCHQRAQMVHHRRPASEIRLCPW